MLLYVSFVLLRCHRELVPELFEGVLVKLGVVVVPWRNGFLCHDLMIDDIVFNLEGFFLFHAWRQVYK